ncbi:MAG TPA: SOS response-associated peptidase [Hyphomicrobiaceae bacterium]|nr:SOS response-associated peptidase [Hyphomicrobiaceae bacterium]
MCSRYSLTSPAEAVRAYFRHHNEAVYPPRYNIAPTQPVAIVRPDHAGRRELVLVRWGLIPPWVKDPRTFSLLINARAESAATKPAFRGAMRHKRCLVPADGFYEWTGVPGRKRPHLIKLRSGGPMALAGLYEHWLGADGSELDTMAILTVPANRAVGALHDRMPAILPPHKFQAWLDVRSVSAEQAQALLVPAADDALDIIEVSPALNDPRNEGPEVQQSPQPRLL